MTPQQQIDSLIAEVQGALGLGELIPQRRTYLEGGLYYLTLLKDLTADSGESRRSTRASKPHNQSVDAKLPAKEAAVRIPDHRTTA